MEEDSSEEDLDLIQQDDQPSSIDDEETREINTLTREQDLFFEAINSWGSGLDAEDSKVRLVDHTGGSWNRVVLWMRQLESLSRVS